MTVPPTMFIVLPQAVSAIHTALLGGVPAEVLGALAALNQPPAAGELAQLPNADCVIPLAQRLTSGQDAKPVDPREVMALLHLLESGTGMAVRGSGVLGSSHSFTEQIRHGVGGRRAGGFRAVVTEHIAPTGVVSFRQCRLVISEGHSKGKEFVLADGGPTTIGALDENQIVIADECVSRRHCVIEPVSDGFLLRDLDSRNGTFLNGTRIKEAYLAPGDRIRIGATVLKFGVSDERASLEPLDREEFGEMVGRSAGMREIFALLEKVSPKDTTVIIEGETGTGKELVAQAIHEASPRRDGPFVVFDCSAVAPSLIESELFGHERGSFTGAVGQRKGAFELADGGTIFLDEIGELPLELQPKLLRVLEQREIRRVGGNKAIKIDVRIVCATNRKLQREVEERRFREDLYYRLFVVKVSLPALRERLEDIPLLVERFLARGKFNRNADDSRIVDGIDDDAMGILMRYRWPGNVRELLNVIERVTAFAEGRSITRLQLEPIFADMVQGDEGPQTPPPSARRPFKEAKQAVIERFEREYLTELMGHHRGNLAAAAREAGINIKHLRGLLEKYGIERI